MSDNVHLLPPPPKQEAAAEIVALLENLLEAARRGDVRAVAYAAATSNPDEIRNGWCCEPNMHHALSSALLGLSHRFGAAMSGA